MICFVDLKMYGPFTTTNDNNISCFSQNVYLNQREANDKLALDWFATNKMKTTPSKFQTIIFRHRNNKSNFELYWTNDPIKTTLVKSLGVTLYDKLCFDDHISRICTRAARQTNVLHRIVKYVSRINTYNDFIASISIIARRFGIFITIEVHTNWERLIMKHFV